MKTRVFIPALVLLITGFLSMAQNRLTWNINVPGTEVGINKVSLEMQDWTGKSLLKDSIPTFLQLPVMTQPGTFSPMESPKEMIPEVHQSPGNQTDF
jgi:hypothetical protein